MNNKNIIKFLEVKKYEVKKKRRNMIRRHGWQYIGEFSELQAIIDYLRELMLILEKE